MDDDYKEKLRLAKEALESGSYDKDTIEYIFPELKGGKDERIRKRLLKIANVWKEGGYACGNSDEIDDIIAWLEKQGKKEEYVLKSSKHEDILKFVQYIEKEAKAYDLNLPNRSYDIYGFAKDILVWLEKQGEQKPADKAESKFHEGDWITDGCLHCKITDVLDDRYIVDTKFAKRSAIPFKYENNYHLWTIQDAKEGDVIYEKSTESIILFKSEDCSWIDSHCSYWQKTKTFECGERQYGRVSEMNIRPATKEQRDLLFAKMKEAGYDWNAEKKQVIKL